jgi:hypothetical protein
VNLKLEASGTFEPNEPAFTEFMNEMLTIQQQSFDEDGGMHAVGVQMMIGHQEGQFAAEDLFMPLQ